MASKDLSFITANPIAHRGLHTKAKGVIENSASAFRAAIAGKFGIECDVQLTADGEAVVFHDFGLERLTGTKGLVVDHKAADLARLTLTGSTDTIGTLADMFALVHGQSLIVCEIKSTFRGDMRLTERVAAIAKTYRGPLVIKSFDPKIVAHWHTLNTGIPVGFVGMNDYSHHDYDACSAAEKHAMANLLHLDQSRPDFLSWRVHDLNSAVPFLWRNGMGRPLMSWTVRTPADVAMATRHADQMVFEGFVPLMAKEAPWRVRTIAAMAEIPRAIWDGLARKPVESASEGVESTPYVTESVSQETPVNPFISHDFLSSLEEAGCVGGRTGWAPAHQLVETEAGTILAAAPCYLKSHSMGEYVFDHAWAEALERAGGRYYPKLQIAVPFTPVTGPRLLGAASEAEVDALAQGFEALRQRCGASSIHATFLPKGEAEALSAQGYLLRSDTQFHWSNEGYASFDGFIEALSSRKRKAIRRERKDALSQGITIEWLTGNAITEVHWDAFFAFYMDTGARKWGQPYLNRLFFSLIGQRMAEKIVLIMARREGRYIAGAINFIGNGVLYGRNWGAIEHHPFLHFEVCYYQAMEFAIAHGLRVVEAGAQGEHKLARGYRPVSTHSAHFIAHPGLRNAVAAYLLRAQEHKAEEQFVLDSMSPFRRT